MTKANEHTPSTPDDLAGREFAEVHERYGRQVSALRQQLAACWEEGRTKRNEYASLLARCEFADGQIATCRAGRDDAVASLAKRSEELAECRSELELLETNSTAVVTAVQRERDVAEAERNTARAACKLAITAMGEPDLRDPLEARTWKALHAALEPTT